MPGRSDRRRRRRLSAARAASAMSKPADRYGFREEILREWRGCDEAMDLEAGIHRPAELMAAVLQTIRAAGAADGLDEVAVRTAWKELAGEFIARHTEPVSVKGGVLVLRVTQPSMRFHLEQMKPLLLGRIQERLGAARIRAVRFALG
jgi:predicted nucleic acid-binding Zn ribbon protein